MTGTLTIRWEASPEDPAHVTYFVDGTAVGDGEAGFERVLQLVRAEDDAQVTLSIGPHASLGGGPLSDVLPFGARVDELQQAAGGHAISYVFE